MKVIDIRWLTTSILVIFIASCGQSTTKISVDGAWVRTPLPSKTTTAAYVRLKNHTNDTITLTSADSETIGAIEFHKSVLREGRHRMVKLDNLEIPPKDILKLEPGGLHLMLFRIKEVDEDKHVINFHAESDLTFQATFEILDDAPE